MSAIFGIIHFDGMPVNPHILANMSATLLHRGADDSGIWKEGAVGLGHRMLWSTPESLNEKLPKNIVGDLVITADARIDNRADLIKQLDLVHYASSETISDSEIILFSYKKWGEDCTEKLLGDFAFAIWDKSNRTLFCARDYFGVKLLYYYYSANLFVFASEIKALLAVEDIPRRLNEVKVYDHLKGSFDDVSSTFYKDIYKLPASCQIVVNASSKNIKKYWSPDTEPELRLNSNEEYAEKFREIFTEAIRCRLRSSHQVGSMLSGGLDSSSIACLAGQLLSQDKGEHLPTFSAVFDTVKQSDERFYINSALSADCLTSSFLHADQISPLADLQQIFWHQDEALYSFNHYLNWGIYKLAKEQGVRVLLDGFDGDTTVSHGTAYLDELAIHRRWLTLARELNGYGKNIDYPSLKLMWKYFHYYQFKPIMTNSPVLKFARRKGKALLKRMLRQRSSSSVNLKLDQTLNADFISRIDLVSHRQKLRALRGEKPKTEKEDHLRKLNWGVMQYTLEVLNKSASAFGIELRFPFWDRRLIDFCLAIPAEQKIQNGWTRFILRNAMTEILPKPIQWRKDKGNLSHAFRYGLLNFEKDHIEKILTNKSGKISQYINIDALRRSNSFFQTGRMLTDEEVMFLWKSTTLALWLEHTTLSS